MAIPKLKMRLGDLLVHEHIITNEHLMQALNSQKTTGRKAISQRSFRWPDNLCYECRIVFNTQGSGRRRMDGWCAWACGMYRNRRINYYQEP